MFEKGQQVAPLLSGPSGVDSSSRDDGGEREQAINDRVEDIDYSTVEPREEKQETAETTIVKDGEPKPDKKLPKPKVDAEEKTQLNANNTPPAYLKQTEVFDGQMLRNERGPMPNVESKTDAEMAVTNESFIPLAFAEETIESLTKK